MFFEFENQVWTPSDASVVVTNNTDTSIDGSSKKIVWTDAVNKYVTLGFDAADLSTYEEISFHIFIKDHLSMDDFLRITIDGVNYDFDRSEFRRGKWNHILIDCSSMGSISEIVIQSLIENLTILIDYLGYRKVTDESDVDIITALKDHINLDYDVETTLSAAAFSGDGSISLTSSAYVTDTSVLEIDDGAGTIETVYLADKSGTLIDPLTNDFSNGSVVRVICPVLGEDHDSVEPDPICGIKVYDVGVNKQDTVEKVKGGSKIKEYLGELGILIYIDCSSKRKLFQMAREFNRKYGKEFQFLLDGEQVDIYIDASLFADSEIGNNPRMAYYYRIEPQPYIVANHITTVNTLTVQSVGLTELL